VQNADGERRLQDEAFNFRLVERSRAVKSTHVRESVIAKFFTALRKCQCCVNARRLSGNGSTIKSDPIQDQCASNLSLRQLYKWHSNYGERRRIV